MVTFLSVIRWTRYDDQMEPRIGDALGDFSFLRPDGTPVRLSEFPARAHVLIFLRHLG
jgi:peroxiredoxin